MVIKSVKLINFRNYESFVLDFQRQMTLVVGGNGSGKTSVIEAVYLALVGKSFRSGDEEIVRRGEGGYRVEVVRRDKVVVVRYDGQKRTFEIGGKKYGRLPAGEKYPVVLFLPSDLNLVGSSPVKKRDYFDTLLSNLDTVYHKALINYSKALRQRNELLKSGRVARNELFAWDVMLARYGVEIEKKRKWLVGEINGVLGKEYRKIAGQKDECVLELRGVGGVSEGGYLEKLEKGVARDKVLGHTSFGVHRDEWCFSFNKETADGNASRGETRSMVLALKFIEADMLERELGKKPLILLDDVFSELDGVRQGKLVKNFVGNQVVVTSVREPGN